MRDYLFITLLFVLVGCVTQPASRTSSTSSSTVPGVPVAPFTPGNKTPYQVFGEVYEVMPDSFGYLEIGVASWYGKKFHGRLTSNGEVYDMYQVTAAHKTLPIPSMVKVTNLDNGKHVILRINDRGPFHDNRIIDLSYAAAKELGYSDKGLAPVVVEALDEMNHPERYAALHKEHKTQFYLQLGAFSELRWANHLKDQVYDLIVGEGKEVGVKILQSEKDEVLLHKVWLGPIASEMQRQQIAAIVEAANLGKPINVEVE